MFDASNCQKIADVIAAFDKLEALLLEEERYLSDLCLGKLRHTTERKTASLMELNKTIRALPVEPGRPLRERFAALQGRLASNERILGLHLEAARKISALITQAVADYDSDGTYSLFLNTPVR
ncbi:MAG: hypothetical protein ACK4MV_10745 [Beijerinckiaceae bacterium]